MDFELFVGTGARFSSLFHYSGRDGIILPLGCAWIAVLSGLIVFGALILYLDAILPGQYGVAKPWYFMMPQVSFGFSLYVVKLQKSNLSIRAVKYFLAFLAFHLQSWPDKNCVYLRGWQ